MKKISIFLAGLFAFTLSLRAERPVMHQVNPPDDSVSTTPALTFLPSHFEFGVNSHWDTSSNLDRAVEMNMGWVRTDVTWETIESVFTEPPTYNWEIADAIVAANRSRGLKMLWGLGGTPAWASRSGKTRVGVPKDAVAVAHYRAFVREFVKRYGYAIDYFWVLNEPNLVDFWEGSVDEYIDTYLIPTYEEVKAVDPSKKIVGPDLALLGSARISVEDFFKRLKRRNAGQYFDIIAQHDYEDTPDDIIEQFERGDYAINFWGIRWFKKRDALYKIYDNSGLRGKPIWLTEFGWGSDEVGVTRQANFIIEMLRKLSRRPRFGIAFIYEIGDGPRSHPKWGMIDADGNPKKVYYKLQNAFVQSEEALYEDDVYDADEKGNLILNVPVDRRPRVYIDRTEKENEK